MKIGYPCINLSLACRGNKTFRLKSYSEDRLVRTVDHNLDCLMSVLEFNVDNGIYFFRIGSDLVPFASHPICKFDWRSYFRDKLRCIGDFIKANNVRISMHPDQFTLINSPDGGIYERSVSELLYHSDVLDCMGLDLSAKVQIHVGGVYSDKIESLARFLQRYRGLDIRIRNRLVIENDDRGYGLQDCLTVHERTGIPVLLDVFHHEIQNSGESLEEAFEMSSETWRPIDGIPMIDYSSQEDGQRIGAHAASIDTEGFRNFIMGTKSYNFDVMLEIKDKERSAMKAVEIASNDRRFNSDRPRREMAYG